MHYLSKNIDLIFIMLGSGCNFQCRYCMQDLDGKPHKNVLPTEINEDIFDFIENIANTQDSILSLQFYGGEPFLYFNKIKYIVEKTKHIKNIRYCAISNGSLITKEIVDFINKYDFHVGISYDGVRTLDTRKQDVFLTNKENILNINNLGLTGVVSAYSSPKDILDGTIPLDNEYYKKHSKHLSISHDEIYDTNLFDRTLLSVDYDKVYKEVEEYMNLWLQIVKGNLSYTEQEFNEKYYIPFTYINNFVKNCKWFLQRQSMSNSINKYITRCMNGTKILNMDLEGNLYGCHNVYTTKLGNIYSNYYVYLINALKDDNTYDTYQKRCSKCEAYPLCQGGCKLITDEVYEQTYCKLKKAVFLPVIHGLLKEYNNGN